MARTVTPPAAAAAGRYPWVVMGIVLAGSYLVVLDTTMLGVALASIAEDLHAEESIGIDWVVTSYLIAVGVVQPATAWLAERFGRKAVYMAALAVFTVASVLAGLAPTLPVLVGARLLQGLGGGAMMPVGMAMVWDQFPPERRGMAISVHSVAVMAAPAFGPVFGGWVVTSASWRLLFLVNLPIGLVALVLAARLLRDDRGTAVGRLDWRGWALASLAVLVVVVGFRELGTWGWEAPVVLGVAAASVATTVAAVRWLRRSPHPVLKLGLFAVPAFRLGTAIVALQTVAMYGRLVFLPTELQVVQAMTAQRVGVLFMLGALGIVATLPLGGWLVDRVGARLPVVGGQVVVAGSAWALANLTPTTSEAELVAILVVGGLGIGLSVTAPSVVAMNALPPEWVGQASTMSSLMRQVAGAIGTSVLAAVVVSRLGAVAPQDAAVGPAEIQSAYNAMFVVVFWVAVATVVLGLFLPGRRRFRGLRHAGTTAASEPAAAT